MAEFINTLIQGLLTGGLYAMFAFGLSLAFGIMRLVNIAHGDLIILGSYLAFVVTTTVGVHPILSLPVVMILMFGLGYLLQRFLLTRTLGTDILPPLLVTFALAIIIQNLLLEFFSADNRKLLAGSIEVASLKVSDEISIGVFPAITFLLAIGLVIGLHWLFYHTALGRSFRATSDDPETAAHVGVDTQRIFAVAMGVALAISAVAAVFLAIRTSFTPDMGPSRLLIAFEAVIIGGLGSIWGTLAGGILLGLSQAIGGFIDPGLQILAGHLAFLVVVALRPQGLLGGSRT